jgi:hypothetical protein
MGQWTERKRLGRRLMRVKGTVVIDFVRMIRGHKDRRWDNWLKPQDWDIVNNRILPAAWYPYDSFQRISYSVFKVIGGSDLDTAVAFGRFTLQNVVKIYKYILTPGDPIKSVEAFGRLRDTFFENIFAEGENTGFDIVDSSDSWLLFRVNHPLNETNREYLEAIGHNYAGSLMELIEKCGNTISSYDVKMVDYDVEITVSWT